MRKSLLYSCLLATTLFLPGCTSTFLGTVFVFTFSDIVSYISFSFVFALIIGFLSKGDFRRNFWTWLILSLVLTPLAGFICVLVKLFSKK